jgi:hypothetical protein
MLGAEETTLINFHIVRTTGLHYENEYRFKEEALTVSNIPLRAYLIHWCTTVCRPTGEVVQWRK